MNWQTFKLIMSAIPEIMFLIKALIVFLKEVKRVEVIKPTLKDIGTAIENKDPERAMLILNARLLERNSAN